MSRKKPYQRKTDYVPQSERSYGIRVVHRDRPNLTSLTELFVRFTLAEANTKRDQATGQSAARPESPKPANGRDFAGEGR